MHDDAPSLDARLHLEAWYRAGRLDQRRVVVVGQAACLDMRLDLEAGRAGEGLVVIRTYGVGSSLDVRLDLELGGPHQRLVVVDVQAPGLDCPQRDG